MSLTNILVHLDSGPRCGMRVAFAARLAARHGAHLTGLFAEMAPARRIGASTSRRSETHLRAATAVAASFVATTEAAGVVSRFLDVDRDGEQEILAGAASVARHFDLVVLGQSEKGVRVPTDLPEHLIMEAGRPVLVLPHAGTYEDIGRRPVFAWNGGRAAARALADAMPLVVPGADAMVVHANRRGESRDEFATLMIDHLAAHGIAARVRTVVVDEIGLMDGLLNLAADHSADLLAMGAFDHPGFALLGNGSGTRYLLCHMTLPVLFSH